MAIETSPLLGNRDDEENEVPSSVDSSKHPHWFRRLTARRNLVPFFFSLVGTLTIVLAVTLLISMDAPKRKNVVLMVSDGMGPASLSLARSFMQYTEDLEFTKQLALDPYIIGTSRTRSSTGATAFSCGIKTYNRAIGVDPLKRPCGTVLEAAKRQGYLTGMVVTSKITDATPASFASHVTDRDYENSIAGQLIGMGPLNQTIDLLFGGGQCHFLPRTHSGSCRLDNKDLLALAMEDGYTYISDRTTFDTLTDGPIPLPLIGLFSLGHMSYAIDRKPTQQPSLAEMTETALAALHRYSKSSNKGFFLLIEGSRIDMASHSNDPAAHVHDVLAFNDAFHVARKFIEKVGGVIISTSDHETGGISVGRQINSSYPEYVWYPEVLANVTHSTEFLGYQVASMAADEVDEMRVREYIEETIVKQGLGIYDATKAEIEHLIKVRSSALLADFTMADMISRRAQIGWATHGHSAVDVNIYASGDPQFEKLRGNHENTEIGNFIKEYLELDLETVTELLNRDKNLGVNTLEDLGQEFGRKYH